MVVDLLIDALATKRATRLFVEDEIMQPLRDRVWKTQPPDQGIGYLFTCSYCMSVWMGAAIALAKVAAPRLSQPVRYALALSAVTCIYEDYQKH